MASFAQKLASSSFLVTVELNPPKGTDLAPLLERAGRLRGLADAFNLTDSHAARMAMTPLAAARLLLEHGCEPIVQLTARDRNRIALQADLLGGAALGLRNFLVMAGDPPRTGDHPDAAAVFDVYSSLLLRAARGMERGTDMAGNPLAGRPRFCLGAVVNPGAADPDGERRRMEEKIEAGAEFFQTQAVYEPAAFERFVRRLPPGTPPLMAGILLLKSAEMGRYMNEHVPGVHVPERLLREMHAAGDAAAAGVSIAARTIGEIAPLCRGVHLIAIGREALIPELLAAAGLDRH